jgi:phenylalanyl-tRNA synthetase beta subunit
MKISYNWLQDYFEKSLPTPEKIAELLTAHAFEVESIDKVADDTVLDVKVLPDRSHDCLCHIGMAREVAILTGLKIKSEISTPDLLTVPESNVLRVEVEDTNLCKRFSALVIENVEVKDSPDWLKKRLESIGQRSINNVVDATNYVMFSIGQPLHAYDRALLKETDGGWKIGVRKAKEGEKVVALGETEYSLKEGNLVITDENANTILGIAAIRGGVATKISKQTKNIILESANFDAVHIRKTAKALGVRTDASVRFENEITPELTIPALKVVSDLILNIAGTDETQIEGVVDVYPRRPNPYKVGVSLSDIWNTLGIDISEKDVSTILDRTKFKWQLVNPREIIVETAEKLLGVPYKYSASVLYEAPRVFSCSSLVNYLYLQGGISLPRVTVDQFVYGEEIEESQLKPGDIIFSNSNSKKEEEFVIIATGEIVRQKVHHTKTIDFMPGTPVPDGVNHNYVYVGDGFVIHASSSRNVVVRDEFEAIKKTQNVVGYRKILNVEEKHFVITIPPERLDLRLKEDLIEEIGRIYDYENLQSKSIKPFEKNFEINKKEYWTNEFKKLFVDNGFSEVITYLFRNSGEVELANPIAKNRPYLRPNLQDGLSEAVELNSHNLELLGLAEVKIFEIGNVFAKGDEHTSIAFSAVNPDEIKKKISETIGFDIDFKTDGNIHEADFDEILEKLPEPKDSFQYSDNDNVHFKSFSQYPYVLRDIAVFVPEGDDQNEIIKVIEKEADGLLVNYKLFDTFTKQFPEGNKTSYAYRLVFQSMERTLTDDEINPIMSKATEILNSKTGWQVR